MGRQAQILQLGDDAVRLGISRHEATKGIEIEDAAPAPAELSDAVRAKIKERVFAKE